MTLGEKLAKLRKVHNYTQEQLAEVLGVSRQAISKWESDITYPETDKLIRMSKLFHCTTDYLLLEDEEDTGAEFHSPTDREETEGSGTAGTRENAPNDTAPNLFRMHLRERKSEKTVCGMPLWHIGRNARGFVAIGLNARGVIAIGLKATGVVSLGMLSVGVFSLGMLSLGLLSLGMLALGILSAGCFSIGVLAMGAISLGILSLGAIAIGDFSVGALAIGKYFALGDHAQAMIAIGDTHAAGSVYQKIGELTAQDIAAVQEQLDTVVPSFLSWARELVRLFIREGIF